jgi:capsular exopolysaccharide synthesis family protein
VPEQQGLRRYLETLRERAWIIAACVILALGAAITYVIVADPVYEAQADILITPVPTENETLVSLGLLRESNDPSREVDTATQLVTTHAVAEQVSSELGGEQTPQDLLDDVKAEPVAQSNIVAVTAQGPSPEEAAQLANTFARTAIDDRTNELHARIQDVLPGLRSQLDALPAGELSAQTLSGEITQLETLAAGPDPTMSLQSPATEPNSPVSPKVVLSIAVAAVVGLIVGIGLAFALRVIDPRLRREEQLGEIFRLPVLARIPREAARSAGPLPRDRLSAPGIEAYRTLRTTLTAGRGRQGSRSILITGPSAGGGKTTSALNLAISMTAAGSRVILIEGDVRRPSIGGALGLDAEKGLVSVLLGEASVSEALTTTEEYGPKLQFLLAEATGPAIAELVSLPVASSVIDEAGKIADYVIVDSPPLTQVIDALPLAAHVDDVLIVVRLGHSRLNHIKELGELLAGTGVTPAGVAIIGVPRRDRGYYGSYFNDYQRPSAPGDGDASRRETGGKTSNDDRRRTGAGARGKERAR